MSTPDITLNNGVTMPALGFGVYQTPPDETRTVVAEALRTGYRHIDTAAAYGNERGVGEALADSDLARDDVFVETKIWISDYGHDETLHAFEKATGKLGLDTLDLLILHQPLTTDFDRTIGAYKALEELLADARVRAIGVSNFMVEDLERLADATTMAPAVNQIEMHPFFQQREVIAKGAERGILAQAWSPIGGVIDYATEHASPLQDPAIAEIARAHGKTPAQIILRWHLQEGRQVIPKSVRPARIAENFDVFDVELSDEELARIDALEKGVRGGPEPASMTLEQFGRPIPEA
jgi:2,5-diketo-D-gluconate reductase A